MRCRQGELIGTARGAANRAWDAAPLRRYVVMWSVVAAATASVPAAGVPLTEQAAQESSLTGTFDVPRLNRILLWGRIGRRWRLGLLGRIKLSLGLRKLFELATVKKNAAAPGALIDRYSKTLHRQHLRHTPRTQQRRLPYVRRPALPP